MLKLTAPFALVALCGLAAAAAPSAERPLIEPHGPCFLAMETAKPFSWQGSCQILCQNGQCRLVCSGGVVFASNDFEARLEAEAILRQQAASQGIIVQGSFQLTVRCRY